MSIQVPREKHPYNPVKNLPFLSVFKNKGKKGHLASPNYFLGKARALAQTDYTTSLKGKKRERMSLNRENVKERFPVVLDGYQARKQARSSKKLLQRNPKPLFLNFSR